VLLTTSNQLSAINTEPAAQSHQAIWFLFMAGQGYRLCAAPAPEPAAARGRGLTEDLAYTMENLLSLCTTCHARREAAERAG
jgi:hypothetical protein